MTHPYTLSTYVLDYFEERPVTKAYFDEMRWMVARIDRWLERPALVAELNEQFIDNWLATLTARSRSPWFRSQMFVLWRAAYREGVCPHDPPPIRRPRKAKVVKAAKQPARQGAVITAETRAKLVQAAQLVLGHSKMDMTTIHYVNGQQMMGPALQALPTPFKKGGAQ